MEGQEVKTTVAITGFSNEEIAFMAAAVRDLELAMRDILDKMTKMDNIKTALLQVSVKMLEKHLDELPEGAREAFDDVKNKTLPFFEQEPKLEEVCVHYDLMRSVIDKLQPYYDMIAEADPEVIKRIEMAPFKDYEDARRDAIDKLKILKELLPPAPDGMNLGDILGGGI